MEKKHNSILILYAEDDIEDQHIFQEALKRSKIANELQFVHNGEELLDFLKRQGKYAQLKHHRLPGLILLDLNMPRMNGIEALQLIKNDPNLRKIPVVVLTVSEADEDVIQSYNLGVNSYIRKPMTFDELVKTLKTFGNYWFNLVELPS